MWREVKDMFQQFTHSFMPQLHHHNTADTLRLDHTVTTLFTSQLVSPLAHDNDNPDHNHSSTNNKGKRKELAPDDGSTYNSILKKSRHEQGEHVHDDVSFSINQVEDLLREPSASSQMLLYCPQYYHLVETNPKDNLLH